MPSSGKKQAAHAAAAAEGNPPVPSGPLEDILVRLDDAADVVRSSATCVSFSDAIADPAFRRRFGRLHHPRPLLGFLECEESRLRPRSFHHSSTPAARAVADAADFTCSFLPDPASWRIRDASGGRLLLSSRAAANISDLMVCDPLHRTFVRVPPVPDHLTAAAGKHLRDAVGWVPFLVPLPAPLQAGDDEKEKEKEEKKGPPLQVVWMLQQENAIIAFVFSSTTGEWLRIPTFWCWSWGREWRLSVSAYRLYAHGSFYWTSCELLAHIALKLDMRKMEFSTMELPDVTVTQTLPIGLGRTNFIVEASEGDLGALVLGDHGLDLYYCRNSKEGDDVGAAAAADWRHSRTVPLPDDTHEYNIVGAGDGYLLLQAYPLVIRGGIATRKGGRCYKIRRALPYFAQQARQPRYFSVKLKTLVFEELPVPLNEQLVFVHLYTNFPPPLSLPSVCNQENTGQDQGMKGEASAT